MKPIPFNTEMVRAILDGRKSVTRRVVKPQPEGRPAPMTVVRPPYQPGDILWVRETWTSVPDGSYIYKASVECPDAWRGTWHPSLHMPREAARIFLRVKDVRVERLQEITEEQACVEGTDPWDEACYENNGWHPTFSDPDSGGDPNMIDGFHKLWNSTIKKSDLDRYGWDANPWVWVIEFERCEKPEGV